MIAPGATPDRLRVLLIEDNPGDARLLRELLNESGPSSVEVREAATLESGFEMLGREKYDVILLDLSLPGYSGLESLKALRKEGRDVPILILTGTDDIDLALIAVREGAQDYLVKGGILGSVLVRAMRYAVERRRAEGEIKRLSYEIMRIQEEERNRLSREIHDVIGQALVALKFQVQNATSEPSSPEKLQDNRTGIIAYINEILKQARELSHSLSPIALRRLGLNRAIQEMTSSLAGAHHMEIVTDVDHLEHFFPDNWDINIYRLVQEAVLNALKHAGASRVEVFARKTKERLIVRIRDDGVGVNRSREAKSSGTGTDDPDSRGLGLLIMNQRAELVGGSLEVEDTGAGTEVRFEVERSRYRGPRPSP